MRPFPAELWHNIGAIACTDGGYTGCSLSLVSHAMRDVMRPVRYTSVALTSPQSCLAFAGMLDDINPCSAIVHLFLSCNMTTWELDTTTLGAAILDTLSLLDAACTKILTRAARTLTTLVANDLPLFNIVGTELRFPNLRDLSIPCIHKHFDLVQPPFPALARLHLSTTQGVDTWEMLALLAPSTTAVRISGVIQDTALSSVLRILLDVPVPSRARGAPYISGVDDEFAPGSTDAVRCADIASRLPHLRSIYIQPLKYAYIGWCGSGVLYYQPRVTALEAVARATVGRGSQLWLMGECAHYSCDQTRVDWADVMDGGDGPWRVLESHDLPAQSSPEAIVVQEN